MTEEQTASYFAYGTLLGTSAMQEYCPSAEPVAVACFAGHQLEFRHYSDEPTRCGCHIGRSDDDLYGVVYTLASEEMRWLDEASGVGKGWFRRIPISVVTLDGQQLETTTYELVDPGAEQWPDANYVGLVRTGALSAGLPAAYVERLLAFLDRGQPARS